MCEFTSVCLRCLDDVSTVTTSTTALPRAATAAGLFPCTYPHVHFVFPSPSSSVWVLWQGGGGAGVDVCQTRQRASAQAAAGAPAPPAQFSSRSMIARISRFLASAGRCCPNAETGGKQAFKQRGTAQQHVVNTRLHCLNRCHTACIV